MKKTLLVAALVAGSAGLVGFAADAEWKPIQRRLPGGHKPAPEAVVAKVKPELEKLEARIAALKAKPRDLHIVVTGRNAPAELVEAADLVTEMTLLKHPFRAGVKAQAGIEF